MYKRKVIRKSIAVFLLGIFLLGITPKKFLHSLFAGHKDYTSHLTSGSATQLSNAGYNCQCDDVVANSPFTTVDCFAAADIPSYNHFVVYPHTEIVSIPLLFSNLRGPPVKL